MQYKLTNEEKYLGKLEEIYFYALLSFLTLHQQTDV